MFGVARQSGLRRDGTFAAMYHRNANEEPFPMKDEPLDLQPLANWSFATLPEGTIEMSLALTKDAAQRSRAQILRLVLSADQADEFATALRSAADRCRLAR